MPMKLDYPEWYQSALEELQGIRPAEILKGIIQITRAYAAGPLGMALHTIVEDGNFSDDSFGFRPGDEKLQGAAADCFNQLQRMSATERRLAADMHAGHSQIEQFIPF